MDEGRHLRRAGVRHPGRYGEDTWDAILEEAGSDGVYTTLGNYPDEEFVALVEAAEPHLGVTGDEALTFVGRHALAHLADQYPSIFERHASTRTFVLQLNDIIHPEVEKLYPGSDLPTFEYEDPEADPLVLGYTSQRRLCPFAEGLILGTSDWYGEEVSIEQPVCMREGDHRCELRLTFGGSGSR